MLQQMFFPVCSYDLSRCTNAVVVLFFSSHCLSVVFRTGHHTDHTAHAGTLPSLSFCLASDWFLGFLILIGQGVFSVARAESGKHSQSQHTQARMRSLLDTEILNNLFSARGILQGVLILPPPLRTFTILDICTIFRPSATVSRIGLMESCMCGRCRVGPHPRPHWLPPPPLG